MTTTIEGTRSKAYDNDGNPVEADLVNVSKNEVDLNQIEQVSKETKKKDKMISLKKVGDVIDNFESGKWDEMDKFDIWLKKELKKELGIK